MKETEKELRLVGVGVDLALFTGLRPATWSVARRE
jgi:hypothetical protein